jgi:CheY-like chemotaxis protein
MPPISIDRALNIMVGGAETTPRRHRILIVEDESLIAVALESMLSEIGYDVVGTVAQVSPALEVIGREQIDGAILDVNLGSQRVDAIADVLAARACPFVFMTGCDVSEVPARHAGHAVLQKPFRLEKLLSALQREFGSDARSGRRFEIDSTRSRVDRRVPATRSVSRLPASGAASPGSDGSLGSRREYAVETSARRHNDGGQCNHASTLKHRESFLPP